MLTLLAGIIAFCIAPVITILGVVGFLAGGPWAAVFLIAVWLMLRAANS